MINLFNKLLIIRTPGIGPAKYADLIKRFGTSDAVVASLNPDETFRDTIKREMERAATLNIKYISDDDELYPANLRAVKNHPPIITVRGNLETLKREMIAIVGTRHATATGMKFIGDMAEQFTKHEITVVSGMAIGTDTAAHRGALRTNGDTQTIAVLAGGTDVIWPLENESLYWEIIERGCIVSEMPVGFSPVANNFVSRNRHVAGLASQLILGEADIKSGSMTTARFAVEYNRPVWAIPSHPADSRADGPNSLIRSGDAKLCIGISDFFKNDTPTTQTKKIPTAPESELNLIDAMGTIPVSESVLAEIAKKSISEIKSKLVVLELQGIVRKVDGGYVRA